MRLKNILFPVLIAAGLSSCMKSSFEQSFTDICTFEYRDTSQYFVNGLFNKTDFGTGNSNALTFCGKRHEESGEFRGGMMVGIRRDSTYREGYIPKELWVVADSVGGAALSKDTAFSMTARLQCRTTRWCSTSVLSAPAR